MVARTVGRSPFSFKSKMLAGWLAGLVGGEDAIWFHLGSVCGVLCTLLASNN